MTIAILWVALVLASHHRDRRDRLVLTIGTALLIVGAWATGES